ncbi:DEAD/DEAH box helicase [Aquabacterium sp. J223]|uniref:DEAD/DEAH box helicase n=1 Tax=Aquabacterium sp. J223 TaxID=2898431 RepID=UPI0021ADC4E5|nr:DEAD/DEAH box helicase [Aquabacterium sp. J223]UUX94473.1 DEAD/DEAH box helicase [Aquabacterium sp. J223]
MPSGQRRPEPGPDTPVPGHFRPRLTLQTLTRGDGLLGLRAAPGFGPRGAQVTVAQAHWTYATAQGLNWEGPAPTKVLATRPRATTEVLRGAWNARVLLQRDPSAEADARDALWASGLKPLPMEALQWRGPEAAEGLGPLWSLAEEAHFADFWAEQVPRLQAQGWQVVVRPGFAHESLPVDRWRLLVDAATGDEQGREPAEWAQSAPALRALRQPHQEGSWRLSLGVDVEGETLDLVPLLADLIKRDARWLDAREVKSIPDGAIVHLRAPGGRRLEAPAAPLKAIVGAMVDLLTDPQRTADGGPLLLSTLEAHRLDALRAGLADTMAERAGEHGAWQLQGEAGLAALAQRLREAGAPAEVPPPPGLGLTLRSYQRQGLAWLQHLREHRLGGILADDMGLGKTAQVLAHVLVEQQAGRLDRPVLVVLPTSLMANWRAEAARIAPTLRTLVLHGAQRQATLPQAAEQDLVITTYPLVWRDIEALAAQPWHLVVLDEAQTVKNAGSRAAAALRRLQTRHRLCVTGTPLENHLGELWAHFDWLMPGFLGSERQFNRQWRRPIENGGETLRAQLLAQRVRPFILRRAKDEVATELPPRTEVLRRVRLEGAQRDLYESVRLAADEQVRRVLERKAFAGSQIAILDALLKLRQVCCDPRLVKGPAGQTDAGSAKLDLLHDMLPALVEEGRRVLVFSQFTELLGLVGRALHDWSLPHLVLTGDTPPAERGALVARFQSREHEPVLLASLKAGGVGLNLTAADTVIHLDPWWNPAAERQASDRAHRIGQDRPVFVYRLVAEGSIEERILALQQRKSALAEAVLGRDAEGAVKFSAEDLDRLLAPLEG